MLAIFSCTYLYVFLGKYLQYMILFCSGLHVCHFLLFVWVSWPIHAACKILLPPPGIEPVPSAVKVQSSNHWTTREFPPIFFFFFTVPVLVAACRIFIVGCRIFVIACGIFSCNMQDLVLPSWIKLGPSCTGSMES